MRNDHDRPPVTHDEQSADDRAAGVRLLPPIRVPVEMAERLEADAATAGYTLEAYIRRKLTGAPL